MSKRSEYLNLLEPAELVEAFIAEPPYGFTSTNIRVAGRKLPAFITKFDLLTTADDTVKKAVQGLKRMVPFFDKINLKPKALFVGTTVTEYVLFPVGLEVTSIKERLISTMNDEKSHFVIVKDIPRESPLLSQEENEFSSSVMSALREDGFVVMSGQALAYVSVNFRSTEEYLERFSRSRRKNMKRKLRSFAEISVEAIKTGDDFFDDANIELLYQLFVNTYDNSSIHFDKLTLSFFSRVFSDGSNGGIVFLYRNHEGIVAFNLCFIFKDRLIDKYIGFRYPEARKYNLYFLSWFHNLDYCIRNNLKIFIVGWTDPEIKAYLGAEFTSTHHAVYAKNPILRFWLKRMSGLFESDRRVLEKIESGKLP